MALGAQKNLYSIPIPILCVHLIIEGGKMKKKISFKTVLIIYILLHEL